jgi:hypothetical protein
MFNDGSLLSEKSSSKLIAGIVEFEKQDRLFKLAFFDDFSHLFHTVRLFFQRYGCLPQDYDVLCQQATEDMQQSDFVAASTYYTICATNPGKRRVGLTQRELPG